MKNKAIALIILAIGFSSCKNTLSQRSVEFNIHYTEAYCGGAAPSDEMINQELQKNFYQFINEYRVNEVKQKLADESFNHLKIISLAFDAGFNSKASFNRVFKSYTGLTPKNFRAKSSNS